jgi:hypothetical protein
MRTDAHGREMAPVQRQRYTAAALLQPFLTGAMIGIGFCLVMGPGLPVLGWGVSAASRSAAPIVTQLSQQMPVWRDQVFAWAMPQAVAADRRYDERLLNRKWQKLQNSLENTLNPAFTSP